jgi:hypothetical protein
LSECKGVASRIAGWGLGFRPAVGATASSGELDVNRVGTYDELDSSLTFGTPTANGGLCPGEIMPDLPPSPQPSAAETPIAEEKRKYDIDVDDPIAPIILQSWAAWRRDLPELLKTHPGKWVAYHGDQRMGFGRTKTELVQKCLRSGLEIGQFLVLTVEREIENDVELPLDI